MNSDIQIKQGFGDIKFDMPIEEVVAILGEPNEVETIESAGDETTTEEIVKLMVDNQYFEQDVDNEDWGERRVTFGEGNIDFYFEDDELISAIIGQ